MNGKKQRLRVVGITRGGSQDAITCININVTDVRRDLRLHGVGKDTITYIPQLRDVIHIMDSRGSVHAETELSYVAVSRPRRRAALNRHFQRPSHSTGVEPKTPTRLNLQRKPS